MAIDVLSRGHQRTVADILLLFWTAKYYIAFFMLFFGVLSALWLALQPSYYRAQMVIGPVERLFSPSEQPVYEPQNVYASTALYNMQRRDSTMELQHFIKMMRSQKVIGHIAEVIPDHVSYFKQEKDSILPFQRRYDLSDKAAVSTQMAHILKRRVVIQPDGLTPFYTVSFEASDKAAALSVISSLYKYSDMFLRQDALAESKQKAAYLKQRLDDEKNRDISKIITTLITQEEQSLMQVQSGSAFAAKVIEAPYVTPYVVWPKPFLIYGGVFIIAFVFGSVLYGLIESIKLRRMQSL